MIREIVSDEISKANTLLKANISEQLIDIKTSLQTYGTRLDTLEERAQDAERRLGEIESKEDPGSATELNKLKNKIEMLENHSRKLNLRFLGIREGAEAGNPTSFTTDLLYQLFGREKLGPPPLLCIAHRTGAVPARGSRCMIARLHSFEVKRTIQRLAAQMGKDLQFQGRKFSIYPDMSAETREQQAAYDDLKTLLRNTGLRYGVTYPAKMLITFQGHTHSFDTPEKAMEFYEKDIKPTLDT